MSPARQFPQDVQWSLQPASDFLSFDQGPLQARIYKDTGHVELAGPDVGGARFGNLVRFAPPAIRTANGSTLFGRVLASKPIANGLELTQSLGQSHITAHLTFIYDGVMRYEVVDWGVANPAAIFEDLIRRFNEASNETAGDHFTPPK